MRARSSAHFTMYRYIAGEVAFSFFVSFLFFFFIFFINQLLLMAEEILSKRAPADQVALLILFSIPAIIAMAAPFASLVGILMAVGRMSSDNEILVFRASGIPFKHIFLPILAVGALISVASFLANDVLLPAGTLEFGKLYKRLLLSTPAIELQSNTVKKFNDTVIVTGPVSDTDIENLLILDRTASGERRMILAKSASLVKGDEASLTLRMGDAFVHTSKDSARDDYDYAIAKRLQYSILQRDFVNSIAAPGPREMASRDVAAEIRKKTGAATAKFLDRKRKAAAASGALQAALRSGPQAPLWNTRSTELSRLEKELSAMNGAYNDRSLRVYRLEYYKKFSIPFAALSFVFLATPLGLLARKSGQSVGFGLGLLLAVLYWAMLIVGQTLGVRMGYSPFWAMWLPDAAVIVAGALIFLVRLRE